MFQIIETAHPPLSKLEVIKALELLAGKGNPTTFLRIQYRTILKFRKTGPFGAEYSAHNFRPSGHGNYLRTEGPASELLDQFRLIQDGAKHPIHPIQGEVINSARIYTKGPMTMKIDIVRHPRKD
jgi:hypothetical protein